jgi:hypothetical protein
LSKASTSQRRSFELPASPHRTAARARRVFDQQANEALAGRVPTGAEVAKLLAARERYVSAAVDLYAKTVAKQQARDKARRRRSS